MILYKECNLHTHGRAGQAQIKSAGGAPMPLASGQKIGLSRLPVFGEAKADLDLADFTPWRAGKIHSPQPPFFCPLSATALKIFEFHFKKNLKIFLEKRF